MSHPSNKNLYTLILVIGVFEIRTYFSLALRKVASYIRGFTVIHVSVIVVRFENR